MTQDFLSNLIRFSNQVNDGFISVLFYSPWDKSSVEIADLADSLNLRDFYKVDIFENPELTSQFDFNLTRSPALVVMNSKRLDVVDIPAAIIRELKYLNRVGLSVPHGA